MYAVIFEVNMTPENQTHYFSIAEDLLAMTHHMRGLISIERFKSTRNQDKVLSLSFWEDEEAIDSWRNCLAHRKAQFAGRTHLFYDYKITVTHVIRRYGLADRRAAPEDSNLHFNAMDNNEDRLS